MLDTAVSVRIVNLHDEPVLFLQQDDQMLRVLVQANTAMSLGDLRVLFRPGTIEKPEIVKLDSVTTVISRSVVQDGANWLPLDEAEKQNPTGPKLPAFPFLLGFGALLDFVAFPLIRKSPLNLEPGDTLEFRLSRVRPDSTGGTRPTRVQTKFTLQMNGAAVTGSALNQLTLINVGRGTFLNGLEHRDITSARVGPFIGAFLGSNRVVNQDDALNQLHIRLSLNPETVPNGELRLRDTSKIVLSFDTWSDKTPWGLVKSQFGPTSGVTTTTEAFENISRTSPSGVTTTDRRRADEPAVWRTVAETAERTGAGDGVWRNDRNLEFVLTVFNAAPPGFAPIRITWTDLVDFPDGDLEVLAQIGPILEDDQGHVGIDLTKPESALHVKGDVTAGPYAVKAPGFLSVLAGRISATGRGAELSFAKRLLDSWPSDPQPGDRFFWDNDNGGASLKTDGLGILMHVTAGGDLSIAGTLSAPRGVAGGLSVRGFLHATESVGAGPSFLPNLPGRISATGRSAEISFAKQTLEVFPAEPQPGDRYKWYNANGSAALGSDGVADRLTVSVTGDLTIAGGKFSMPGMQITADGVAPSIVMNQSFGTGSFLPANLDVGTLKASFTVQAGSSIVVGNKDEHQSWVFTKAEDGSLTMRGPGNFPATFIFTNEGDIRVRREVEANSPRIQPAEFTKVSLS